MSIEKAARSRVFPRGFAAHPSSAASIDQLPDELRSQARKYLPLGEQVTKIIVNPRAMQSGIDGRRKYRPEHALIFTASGVLSVQETGLDGLFPEAVFICAADVLSVQVSLILLYGRLEIIGAQDGRSRRIVLEFNTIGYNLIKPALEPFLALSAARCADTGFDPAVEDRAWQQVGDLHIKYWTGLSRHAVGRSEHLKDIVFQPAIRVPVIFGFTRRAAFPVLFALTNYHLIILGEELAKNPMDYGWVISYCPLSVIQGFEVVEEKETQRLVIHLQYNNVRRSIEVKVGPETAHKIAEEWGSFLVA